MANVVIVNSQKVSHISYLILMKFHQNTEIDFSTVKEMVVRLGMAGMRHWVISR